MLRFIKNSLLTPLEVNGLLLRALTLMLTISLAGSVLAVCPLGDLSGNCEVDWEDLQVFAGQWLDVDSSREGLVAHWKLDGNADDPVGGNHGTVYGNPVWTPGQVDGALYFGGAGDYVVCGNDSSVNLTDNFSISTWFNFNNTGQATLVCKGNVPADEPGGAYTILCNLVNGEVGFFVRKSKVIIAYLKA